MTDPRLKIVFGTAAKALAVVVPALVALYLARQEIRTKSAKTDQRSEVGYIELAGAVRDLQDVVQADHEAILRLTHDLDGIQDTRPADLSSMRMITPRVPVTMPPTRVLRPIQNWKTLQLDATPGALEAVPDAVP